MDSSPTTDSSTYTQSIQRSKHHNSNGLLKLKRKRKYKKKVQNPAERLEMSRIRSAQTICSGKYRVLYTYIPEYVLYCPITALLLTNSTIILPQTILQTQWIESLQPRNPHRRRQNPSSLLDLKRLGHQPRCLAGKRLEIRPLCMGLQGCCVAVSIVAMVSGQLPLYSYNNIHPYKGQKI